MIVPRNLAIRYQHVHIFLSVPFGARRIRFRLQVRTLARSKNTFFNFKFLQASFDHVHKYLKIYITLRHTCEKDLGVVSSFILEVEYSSIARTIVDMKELYTDLYLRLTHPAILYGSKEDFGNTRPTSTSFRDFSRYNVLGCSNGCPMKIASRRLGGCNTIRLRWKNAAGIVKTLHTIFSKLQRSENVVASMKTKEKPRNGIKEVSGNGVAQSLSYEFAVSSQIEIREALNCKSQLFLSNS